MFGGEERCIQVFCGETLQKRPLGRPSVDGRIILRWIFRKWDGGMDWFDLDQVMDKWCAKWNVVLNLRDP